MSAADSANGASSAMAGTGSTIFGLPVWALIFLLSFTIRAVVLAVWASNHEDFYRLGGEGIGSHSTLYALMPWLSGKLGMGMRAGILAGLGCALIPMQGLGEAIGVGATAHASLVFALLAVAFRNRWRGNRSSFIGSVLLGIACGAAFHVLPPSLLVIVGYLIFELWWKRGRHKWLFSTCVAAGAILACVPWTWRNYAALHGFFFIRSNFGRELRIANHTGADADIDVTLARQGTLRYPSENLQEARQVRDLGEVVYMRRGRNEALEWIRTHPAGFLRLTLMRFLHFWCGPRRVPWLAAPTTAVAVLAALGLRRLLRVLGPPGRAALLIPLLTFPLVYYVVSYVAHYPAPLAWILVLLAGYEVRRWIDVVADSAG